jgi:hypothetical protein
MVGSIVGRERWGVLRGGALILEVLSPSSRALPTRE